MFNIRDRIYFCYRSTTTIYSPQTCSELSQYLLEFFPIPYPYRTHCSDKSEFAVCDRLWTLFLSKHVTFWVRHGFLVWGPQKRVNFREKFWDSQKSSEMPGHHATLGRTRPFPLKIVKFPGQTFFTGFALTEKKKKSSKYNRT